jgi:D-alanine transaminase
MVPTILITVREHAAMPDQQREQGLRAILVPEIRWGRRDIKSTNLLPNILAKREAHERGAHEAIFVTEEGWVDEGSSTNLFIIQGGVVRTPPNGPALLPGITRDLVVETARREGLPMEEGPVSRESLLAADEVFLTGTSTEVAGVVQIDGKGIGLGSVGPITRHLHAAYRARIAAGDDAP